MAVEKVRGCGYRKVGGLYLCGSGMPLACDRLPYLLKVCPTCGAGVKFTRGFSWLDWDKYAGLHTEACSCMNSCPICVPDPTRPYGLLWIGEQYYTPDEFIDEALKMGVSRRIAAIPKNLKLGETWVLFAHKRACGEKLEDQEDSTQKRVGIPGILYAHRPQTLELLIWESDATEKKLAELEKRHITPIIIPDGDIDHDPDTPLKMDESVRFEAENISRIVLIRASLKR